MMMAPNSSVLTTTTSGMGAKKGGNALVPSQSVLLRGDSEAAIGYGQNEFARDYKSLTEYDKKKHDGVKAYV